MGGRKHPFVPGGIVSYLEPTGTTIYGFITHRTILDIFLTDSSAFTDRARLGCDALEIGTS